MISIVDADGVYLIFRLKPILSLSAREHPAPDNSLVWGRRRPTTSFDSIAKQPFENYVIICTECQINRVW